jgi:hypothetical protein
MATYQRGSIFSTRGVLYILARGFGSSTRTGSGSYPIALINLNDGNIWSHTVLVEDINKVTEAELKVCIGDEHTFTFVCGPVNINLKDVVTS